MYKEKPQYKKFRVTSLIIAFVMIALIISFCLIENDFTKSKTFKYRKNTPTYFSYINIENNPTTVDNNFLHIIN
ncbi:hypothetical protein L0P54_03085 [Anaerosalibacter bizertensis]|uniref:Uncharacterized protein n=1 Tax=Anaerosalibacter bizertensis TaxID=932217 RepID=A0A9Q4ACA0_9FIRM|nr:hypothetical protein [Anaerosalibacter bizertensis]MBV1819425.1 hypothetical protein [Bacteroidales bacterium MSK.15.36]MCB5559145.1 hypothetical protein [Anaerosalibacter bizertensis]MCG4564960.1 hypothetical protein [Anaerosalibacter bizertensis]MCG4581960.1 hypothetical protein [Anaerosalibacter bizertensis]MCG4586252.1 hypothetical protein [Anaerosalibacter bizertensis]